MNIKRLVPTTLFVIMLSTFFIGLVGYKDKPVHAEATCPSTMSDYECYVYLSDLALKLQNEQSTIQKQLTNEQYNQLSLEQKIDYMTNQINQAEKAIKSLEIEIAAHDIEIKMLENGIQEKEDSISLLGQEVDILESTVNQRITESYKYSFITTLDLFLDTKNLSEILRKTKYLITTRAQDVASLEDYSMKVTNLKKEKDELAKQEASLLEKKQSIEKEKNDLANQNNSLAGQRSQKAELLAESKAKEAELLATYKQNKQTQSEIDAKLTAYVNSHMGDMIDGGYVAKGSLIGYIYPGGNSCSGSTGPHLHFAITTTSSGTFYPNVDIWAGNYLKMGAASQPNAIGWKYPYAYSGGYTLPIASSGVVVTQDYHDPNLNYEKDAGEGSYYATDLSKLGGSGGAAVVAAQSGTLSRYKDWCGQDYVIIKHSNGYRSMYLHITYSR